MKKISKIAAMKSSTILSKRVNEIRKPVKTAVGDPIAVTETTPKGSLEEPLLNNMDSNTITADTPATPLPAGVVATPSLWNYPAKLIEITQQNSKFVSHFAGRFASVRTAQDMLTVSSDFSHEGNLLFRKQSSAVLKMFAGGAA